MGSLEADNPEAETQTGGANWWARAGLALLVIVVAAGVHLWLSRERIAGNLIDDYLAQSGLEASYEIVSIGPQRQIISNVIVGDPVAPDLTIERVMVDVAYGFGAPGVGKITLEQPRLYGSFADGALSFGALDPLLFDESETASTGLPALDVTVRDGGARLATPFGDVGAFLEGSGPLNDGFAGKLALLAPNAGEEGCGVRRASAYGDLTIESGVPSFAGPLRLRDVSCEGAQVATADASAAITTNADFDKLDASFDLTTGALVYQDVQAQGLDGRAKFSLGAQTLLFDHDLRFSAIESDYASLAQLRADGALRSAQGFAQTSWNAQLEGEDIGLPSDASEVLADARAAGEGTLIAPLLAKLERGLADATTGASLRADVTARRAGDALSVVVPEAQMRSASGETVLAISRLSWSRERADSDPRLVGNFLMGGAQLPRLSGRVDQSKGAGLQAKITAQPFSAGDSSIAIPSLAVRGLGGGAYAFAGRLRASGAIPGGAVSGLEVPLNGTVTSQGGLRLGRECQDVRFEALAAYDVKVGAQSLSLCPGEGGAMLAYDDALSVDLVTQGLALDADLAGSPFKLNTSEARLAYPGGFALDDVSAVIGPSDNATRMTSALVSGTFDDQISGEFTGATAQIDAVPLNLSQMVGRWSYAQDILSIADARFIVTERTQNGAEERFNPILGQDASLTFTDSRIQASADLNHRDTGAPVAGVVIRHDLSSAQGSAVFDVDALTFGSGLSLADLSPLALGVVADTQGTVSGEGLIEWTGDEVTSTGVFRTDDLDLAAAFGPVTGLKGEVVFTDLLALTTAPNQRIEIGSINPGIEALNGQVEFSLINGEVIEIGDARWPFMGGELIMRPTRLLYGTDAEQSYVFEVIALDAARFVAQMELSNISATGTFDGTIGITFDARGDGRIDQGLLISREPGGNVSYIGELTYEDMGAISNYAFQSLRSLDYRQMRVGLEGDLAGEIITRFTFDGIRQGQDANQDFITRRLAKLPIRFNVNVRSENFYELATMVRTFWDPEALPDAIDTGVITADQARSQRFSGADSRPAGESALAPQSPAPGAPDNDIDTSEIDGLRRDDLRVQPPESESLP